MEIKTPFKFRIGHFAESRESQFCVTTTRDTALLPETNYKISVRCLCNKPRANLFKNFYGFAAIHEPAIRFTALALIFAGDDVRTATEHF